MKLDLKNFDWKQFLLMKGELVGIGIAGFLTVLIIGLSLFLPEHGLFTKSASENASVLSKDSKSIVERQRTNKPTEADMPKSVDPVEVAAQFETKVTANPERFQLGELFAAKPPEDTKRRPPDILACDEGVASVAHVQVKSYILNQDFTQIAVLKGVEVAKGLDGGRSGFGGPGGRGGRGGGLGGGMGGPGRGGMGGPAGGGMGGPGRGGMGGPGGGLGGGRGGLGGGGRRGGKGWLPPGRLPGSYNQKDQETSFIPLVDFVSEKSKEKAAETVRPLRMADIELAFPFKKQVEEFQKKLHLKTPEEALFEIVEGEGKEPMPAFRFMGANVQRREVDVNGVPVLKDKNNGWENLDVAADFRPYVILTGRRFEKEDANLEQVSYTGLVMPKLLAFRPGEYPKITDQLKNIAKTLAALTAQKAELVASPDNRFNPDGFDPFDPGKGGGGDTKKGGGAPAGTPPPPGGGDSKGRSGGMGGGGPGGPGRGMGGGSRRGGGGEGIGQDSEESGPSGPNPDAVRGMAKNKGVIPDHCLVRLFDVTIEPGKIYEYRVQVRMINPNFGRKDVASPNYAKDEVLVSDKWFQLPQKLAVPSEQRYYVVDQKELDKAKPPKDLAALLVPQTYTPPVDHERQVVFQVQKWLDSIPSSKDKDLTIPIGEWAVAERIPVCRGEYVGRKVRVEVPVWRPTLEEFVIPTDATSLLNERRLAGIEVNMGSEPPDETILVDFEGGNLSYEREARKDDATKKIRVQDKAALETVLLSPEGKLLAHNELIDTHSTERETRLEAFRTRVKEVKEGEKHTKKDGKDGSPFGGGGPP